ncbi:MAG: G5 domain-containing protein [Acidaminococcaceae bacterium]|nr:G5 domain-containing protein [Acidaminococcaceae bacterium]
MKKDRIYLTKERLLQGLAGMLLSVSALVLPVTGYAEDVAATQATADGKSKYVMPREQVYLDPSQVEAAKKQLEADAYYNANPQNAAPVSEKAVEQKEEATKPVAEEKVVKDTAAEVVEPAVEEKRITIAEEKAATGTTQEVKPVVEEKQIVLPQEKKEKVKPAEVQSVAPVQEEKKEAVAQPKYVMPQDQIYLDPTQAEAAKQQLQTDAYYNANPQPAAPVSEKAAEQKEKATKPVAEEKTVKETSAEVTKPAAEEKVVKEVVKESKSIAEENVAKETVKKELADEKQVNVAESKEIGVANTEAEEKSKTETKENVEVKTKTEIATEPEIKSEAKSEFNTEEKPEVKSEVNEIKPEAPKPAEPMVPGKKSIQIRRFGTAKEFVTHHNTVADVLKDMKINMEGRSSYPSSETKITDGMVIHVLGRKSFVSHEEVEVPFQTKTIDDPELTFGEKKVEKAGVKGKDIVTYENITRIGYEQKIELDRRHVTAPVDEIVRQGIAQSVLTPEGYKRYKKKIYGEATAYTWGGGASGTTSLGLWPKRGIVAVDPRMIPYYTKMYIPGYGMAIAGDTGGAIVGHRIDLFMESLYECYQWGRRDVEIYILE